MWVKITEDPATWPPIAVVVVGRFYYEENDMIASFPIERVDGVDENEEPCWCWANVYGSPHWDGEKWTTNNSEAEDDLDPTHWAPLPDPREAQL